jgi:hypothetical protein
VRTRSDYDLGLKSQRLADLADQTAELERKLSDARISLERELAQSPYDDEMAADDPRYDHHMAADDRTEALVSRGRSTAYSPGISRRVKVAVAAAVAAALVTLLALRLFEGGAAWPASVATVQRQSDRACLNPDVKSDPGQVNFACAQSTRQILWVFALMTSGDDREFADAKTGRVGLEPITPAQGGQVAWSLNLHHPYDPTNPVDSLAVAARAINNIVGGATVTGANGHLVIQPGLESNAANCVRYTGSGALTSRKGYPRLCAKPVTSPAGEAALVADIYQKWMVGAPPEAAQQAVVLFENADNPGDPRVQAVLQHLPHSRNVT